MLGEIDLREVQHESSDTSLLQAYLQQLVGQPFLHFRFSYGDELTVHFGQAQQYSSPKMKHLTKGAYILGARAANWFLRSESPASLVIGSNLEEWKPAQNLTEIRKEDLEASGYVKKGAQVVFATPVLGADFDDAPTGYGVSILFSDGSSLLIAPGLAEQLESGEDEVADWELFTPYERYLRVGPGPKWAYLPSRHGTESQSA